MRGYSLGMGGAFRSGLTGAASTVVGAALQVSGYVNVPLAVALGVVAVVGYGYAAYLWFRDRGSVEAKPPAIERMPLLAFAIKAGKRDWDILKNGGLGVLDLLVGLRQAGSDGAVQLYGREQEPNKLRAWQPEQVLTEIPREYWLEHEIDPHKLHVFRASQPVAMIQDNRETETKRRVGNFLHGHVQYTDIHVRGDQALDWLDGPAKGFRGHTQRNYG